MKRVLRIVLLFAMAFPAVISCDSGGRVIPVGKMERIYREMLLADQWLAENPDKRGTADTTWFYEPIFRKYGYSLKDYQKSVDRYLNDPSRYADMLGRVESGLRKDLAALNGEIAREDRLRHEADSIYRAFKSVKAKPFHSFLDIFTVDSMTDRVEMEKDSLGVYRPVPVIEDTVYHGPMLVIRDTSEVAARDSVIAVASDILAPLPSKGRFESAATPRKALLDRAAIKEEKIISKDLLVTE